MPQNTAPLSSLARSAATASRTFVHHFTRHAGIGVICAIAYFDPGNWSVDLQAGANFGYRPMLFVILVAGLGAIVLQTLAIQLGCVTGLDLASHCRLLLYNRTRRPRLVRFLVLYPLYVLCELAIISTDLAELLGSAIGLCLIFPKLPLYAGVLLTAADVLIFLAISDPYKGHGRPVRTFELVIVGLVLAVFTCFITLLVKAKPDWNKVFMGYIPDHTLVKSQPDAVYAAVGILGATVMPHALFLGSSLATQDRVSTAPSLVDSSVHIPGQRRSTTWFRGRFSAFKSIFDVSRTDMTASKRDCQNNTGERENNSLLFVRQHIRHGVADVVASLLLIAVPISSAILIIAAAVFYTGQNQKFAKSVGLFDAHDLIQSRIGSGASLVFALALVCAGQASSVTATLAGQIVSEGFIEWRVSPFLRRLITRLISLVPSVTVSVTVGRDGINTLLVASQVILSIVLPFVAFPLIYLTSSEKVMRVRKPLVSTQDDPVLTSRVEIPGPTVLTAAAVPSTRDVGDDEDDAGLPFPVTQPRPSDSDNYVVAIPVSSPVEKQITELLEEPLASMASKTKDNGYVDFRSNRLVTGLAYAIWCVVLIANVYAIAILSVG